MVMSRYAGRVRPLGASSTRRPVGTTISLGGGYAFPRMLPDISAAAAVVARQSRVESLQYGPHAGVPALRTEIVRFLAEDGIQATDENILVLNGAKQGLDLAARLFLDQGDTVIVSRPNYATGCTYCAIIRRRSSRSRWTATGCRQTNSNAASKPGAKMVNPRRRCCT